MSIRAELTSDFKAIDLSSMTELMRAEVTADFVKERFRVTDAANAVLAGGKLPFTLEVSGQVIVRGSVGIFPEKILVAALQGRHRPIIDVTWHYEFVRDSALEQVITAYTRANATLQRIQNFHEFAMLVMNARSDPGALLRWLLVRYARYQAGKSPQLMRGVSEARRLYKTYRRIQLAQGLLSRVGAGNAEEGAEVLAWIAEELRVRSPVLSGEYRDAHELYADGSVIANAADVAEDMELPEAEEFSFTNTVPYARKIEMGKTKSGRDFVVQVEPHIYENVAQDAQAQFRDVAEIRYEMRAVIDGEQAPRRGVRSARDQYDARKVRNQPSTRFPSIVVRFL